MAVQDVVLNITPASILARRSHFFPPSRDATIRSLDRHRRYGCGSSLMEGTSTRLRSEHD